MQDEEYRQRVPRPIFQVAHLAIEDVIVTPWPEIGRAGLYLQGKQLPSGLIVFDNLDLRVNTVVADRLLTEQPTKLIQENRFDGVDALTFRRRVGLGIGH